MGRRRERAGAELYDRIAGAYVHSRRPDPRIASQIWHALGEARSVVNVGAGLGAYEPIDRDVVAIEPSASMVALRPPGAARVIQASAEQLPLADNSVDAAMAVLTLHHWTDYRRGLKELGRVARERVVIATWDPAFRDRFWLTRDYLTELGKRDAARFPSIEELAQGLGDPTVTPVPIPHDCIDGFEGAFWRRPRAYLDHRVRAAISTFHLCGEDELEEPLRQLADDIQSGRWVERNRGLVALEELDLGYRLLVAMVGRVA